MSHPTGVDHIQAARRARGPSRGARLLAQVRLLNRSQGDRHPVFRHGTAVPPLRLYADDAHALAARLPGRAAAAHRRALRRRTHAGRDDAPRVLQRARCDARHHHGLPRRRAPRRRRIREFRAAAPDRRAGHGLPEDQHGRATGASSSVASRCSAAFSSPAAPRNQGGPPTRRSPSSPAQARRGGSSG